MTTSPTPRWSKADTHCVWCGKPMATDGDLVERGSECLLNCGAYDSEGAMESIALSLRATVEAQGKVIERLRAHYRPVHEVWVRDGTPEAMTPSERVVLYGAVVNEEAGDSLTDLGDARAVLWFCPHRQERGCKFVEWDTDVHGGMTPRCVDCGEVGPTRTRQAQQETPR